MVGQKIDPDSGSNPKRFKNCPPSLSDVRMEHQKKVRLVLQTLDLVGRSKVPTKVPQAPIGHPIDELFLIL